MMPIKLIRKILLLDDKPNHIKGCGFDFMNNLESQLSKYIDFISKPEEIAHFQNEFCELNVEVSDYLCLLFHDSYEDGLFTGTEQALLKEKFGKNMIGFSGDALIQLDSSVTSRELVFQRLKDILIAYHYIGQVDLTAFFNPNFKLQSKLIDKMIDVLENREKKGFLESEELKIWSEIKGSNLGKLKENLSVLTEVEIVDRIENNWRIQELIWSI